MTVFFKRTVLTLGCVTLSSNMKREPPATTVRISPDGTSHH